MYEIKEFKPTPSNARKLIAAQSFTNIRVPTSIRELAEKDLIDNAKSTLKLDELEIASLQVISDHGTRGMILHPGKGESVRRVAISAIEQKNLWPVLIIADKNEKKFWIPFLKGNFPDKKIVFDREVDVEYDIHILRSTKINYDKLLLKENRPKSMILDAPKATRDYNLITQLAGLSKEFWHSIFLYNLSEAAKFPKPLKALMEINNRSYANFITFIREILIPYSNTSNILDQKPGPNNKLTNYLDKIGYNTTDIDDVLSLFGIDDNLMKRSKPEDKDEITNREL